MTLCHYGITSDGGIVAAQLNASSRKMKSALLIIDLQIGLFEGPGKPFDYDDVILKINSLSEIARKFDSPVIFIQHETEEDDLRYKSRGWQLVDDLNVDAKDHFVRKTTPNSFLRTNLEEILENNQVEKIIVCGYATEFCVDSTIRAAAALGYSIHLVSDGHTTHDKEHAPAKFIREHHNQTLPNIKSFGVEIKASKAEEIIRNFG